LQHTLEAYLDIETTGLSPKYSEITVVGIHLHNGIDAKFIQLLGGDVTADKISEALQGVNIIYTYNGSLTSDVNSGHQTFHAASSPA